MFSTPPSELNTDCTSPAASDLPSLLSNACSLVASTQILSTENLASSICSLDSQSTISSSYVPSESPETEERKSMVSPCPSSPRFALAPLDTSDQSLSDDRNDSSATPSPTLLSPLAFFERYVLQQEKSSLQNPWTEIHLALDQHTQSTVLVKKTCPSNSNNSYCSFKSNNNNKLKAKEEAYLENPKRATELLRHITSVSPPSSPGLSHIVQLLDSLETPTAYWQVFEFLRGGELFDAVVGGELLSTTKRRLFRQLMQAVETIHAAGVAHLDISLENCMLTDPGSHSLPLSTHSLTANNATTTATATAANVTASSASSANNAVTMAEPRLKLIDFGFARQVDPSDPWINTWESSRAPGKIGYMAPEIFAGVRTHAFSADIYSCGVVLFMLLTGCPPYDAPAESDRRFHMVHSGRITELLSYWRKLDAVPPLARDLLSSMLGPMHKRPSASQVLASSWLSG